jgi:hypothetical protein
MNVFPDEQDGVLIENALNVPGRKLAADSAALLVLDNTARLVEHFPSALPRQEP